MQRQPKTLNEARQLVQAADLVSSAAQTIIAEWSKEAEGLSRGEVEAKKGAEAEAPPQILPSHKLYEAQRTVLAAVGKLTELVSEPSNRLLEVSSQYNESRALFIAAERLIPDLLAGSEGGMPVTEISNAVKIESRKLSRLLRTLCSIGIFQETAPDVFANNTISAALIGNEPLRAYIQLFNLDLYTASERLPKALLDSTTGPSYDVAKTAFQDAVGDPRPRWEWLEDKVEPEKLQSSGGHYAGHPSLALGELPSADKDGLAARPEHSIFGLAMLGGGRVFGAAHIYDFPWGSLGNSTVVDVGGGVGGFALQLSKTYPDLRFVVQDRGPVLKQAETEVWPKENPAALQEGRVQFVQHDFFQKNPTPGADVYWLRYIMHDWSDDYCVQILSGIRQSMAPHSRILICDQVMNTTAGFDGLKSAPSPLPANYGYYTRYSHQRDLTMMTIINGIERTPAEFQDIIQKAGLRLSKIWECRSQVALVEAVLA